MFAVRSDLGHILTVVGIAGLYHSPDAIMRNGHWNMLRLGRYAYCSFSALTTVGFSARTAWRFDLYGGTVLLAARGDSDGPRGRRLSALAPRHRGSNRDPRPRRPSRAPARCADTGRRAPRMAQHRQGRGPDCPGLQYSVPGQSRCSGWWTLTSISFRPSPTHLPWSGNADAQGHGFRHQSHRTRRPTAS